MAFEPEIVTNRFYPEVVATGPKGNDGGGIGTNDFPTHAQILEVLGVGQYHLAEATAIAIEANGQLDQLGTAGTPQFKELSVISGLNTPVVPGPIFFSDSGSTFWTAEYTGDGDYTGFAVTSQKAGGGTPFIQLINGDLGTRRWSIQQDSNGDFSIRDGTASGTITLSIDNFSGNIGIYNTNPTARLHIKGVNEGIILKADTSDDKTVFKVNQDGVRINGSVSEEAERKITTATATTTINDLYIIVDPTSNDILLTIHAPTLLPGQWLKIIFPPGYTGNNTVTYQGTLETTGSQLLTGDELHIRASSLESKWLGD